MKNLPSILSAIALAAVFGLYMCTYQVRFTEVAIVKTFGKANQQAVKEPGLKFKWPPPIQNVVKYDTRIRLLEDTPEETPTRDSNNVIVSTFTAWKIADPYQFHRASSVESDAEDNLRTRIRAHKKTVIGKHDFSEFVSTDPQERKLAQIESEMEKLIAADAKRDFGISIEFFGIKQLTLPQEVTQTVFDTMKKVEQNKADNFKAQGEAEATKIVAQAGEAANRIMSVARQKADEIRADGRAEVSRLASRFDEAPELRIFLDKLEAFEQVLHSRSIVVLDLDYPPIDLFKLDGVRASTEDNDTQQQAGRRRPEALTAEQDESQEQLASTAQGDD
ncbi:MAG: protease modulator HflC [Planctomycetes bacterium]|nr:protease modulator HflC [Planctomycetota bacterium]